jgi:hypothetical protein
MTTEASGTASASTTHRQIADFATMRALPDSFRDSYSETRSRSLEHLALTSNVISPFKTTPQPGYAPATLEPTPNNHHRRLTSLVRARQGTRPDTNRSRSTPTQPTARPTPLTRPKFCREKTRKIQPSPQEKSAAPTTSNHLLPHCRSPLINQYNPCRGSSIGRACGSYNSKEINLKVVGSSPTFGYSYHIKLIRAAVLFAFFAGGLQGTSRRLGRVQEE